jgi:hypothetical protein
MTQLSEHFTLEQLIFSQTASRKGINNTPSKDIIDNLTTLCNDFLEPARNLLNTELHIDSGFRCLELNTAVGGSATSEHLYGCAADCIPQGLDLQKCFDILKNSDLQYDQIIFECKAWIHIGMCRPGGTPRREALTATGGPGAWHYKPA